ncbi:hypothetical protein [Flavobacterium sp.]|uniref:hypothetical protein n=1 Tax=Flavobacterium sp. TaxID=239 RepID=UPI00404A32C2
MNTKEKIFFATFTCLVYYIGMDYSDESFFNFKSVKFYLKFLISIILGIVLVFTIKGKKSS